MPEAPFPHRSFRGAPAVAVPPPCRAGARPSRYGTALILDSCAPSGTFASACEALREASLCGLARSARRTKSTLGSQQTSPGHQLERTSSICCIILNWLRLPSIDLRGLNDWYNARIARELWTSRVTIEEQERTWRSSQFFFLGREFVRLEIPLIRIRVSS